MLHTLFAGTLALAAWIAWHLAGDMIAEAVGYLLRPITRPIWRSFVRARWPWPLLAMLCFGGAATAAALRLMSETGWRGMSSIPLFFAGVGLTLFAPILWRDAKREGERTISDARRV